MNNCLLITPNFNGLDSLLFNAVSKKFSFIDHFFDRPNNFFFKTILRLKIPIISSLLTNLYYKLIYKSFKNTYDVALIINPEALPKEYLNKIMDISCKTVIYFWDGSVTKPSINSYSNIKNLHCYSFDKNDCSNLGFTYLPLFIPEDNNISTTEHSKTIDICFIASCHNQRLLLANELNKLCNLYGFKYMIRLSAPSFLHFIYFNLIAIFKKYKIKVAYSTLPHEKYIEFISKSKVIVDITSDPNQSGVSLRSFEALGRGCKLLTNNQAIKQENYYNENLISFFCDLPSIKDIDSILKKVAVAFDNTELTINYFVDRLLD